MSFNVIFKQNASENIVLDKELTTVATLAGTLKESTSIIDPVIIIQGDESVAFGCNYMEIPAFGRSYFITNMRAGINHIIEVSGHVDVLTTYKDVIRANSAITRRQERDNNLYLNDGIFKLYQNPHVMTYHFKKSGSDFIFSGETFILGVAGIGQEPEE